MFYLTNYNSKLIYDAVFFFVLFITSSSGDLTTTIYFYFQSFPILETAVLLVAAAITLHFIFKKSRGKSPPKTLLDPQTKYALPLCEKEEINHDTRRFR